MERENRNSANKQTKTRGFDSICLAIWKTVKLTSLEAYDLSNRTEDSNSSSYTGNKSLKKNKRLNQNYAKKDDRVGGDGCFEREVKEWYQNRLAFGFRRKTGY